MTIQMAKRILCPTDFSIHSAAAVEYACCLAKAWNAKVYFLHVEEDITPYDAGFGGYVFGIADLEEEQAELLKVRPADPETECEHFSVVGHPAEAIIEFAKTHDVDLIVLGTHGRTGVVRMVVGSVAEKVIRNSDCPVLTVRQPVNPPVCPPADMPAADNARVTEADQ